MVCRYYMPSLVKLVKVDDKFVLGIITLCLSYERTLIPLLPLYLTAIKKSYNSQCVKS